MNNKWVIFQFSLCCSILKFKKIVQSDIDSFLTFQHRHHDIFHILSQVKDVTVYTLLK